MSFPERITSSTRVSVGRTRFFHSLKHSDFIPMCIAESLINGRGIANFTALVITDTYFDIQVTDSTNGLPLDGVEYYLVLFGNN